MYFTIELISLQIYSIDHSLSLSLCDLFVYYLLITFSAPGSFHEKFHVVKESYMMNNTILAINVPTYADCMRLCSRDIMCLSVNYNRYGITDYNCILNSHSRFVSRNLTSDSTVAGFNVKEWTYYEQQFKGP